MDSLKNKVSTLQYAKTILDEYRQLQDPFVAEVSAICDERLTELNLISPNDFEHLRRVMDV
jgi:hypothetical protein